jgi:hypothetical protein
LLAPTPFAVRRRLRNRGGGAAARRAGTKDTPAMIDITLDDGTILDIETDDPAQANAAAWNYLTERAGAQSATSPYPPEFMLPQQPGAALAFAAPTHDAPAVNASGTTDAAAIDEGEDDAPLWQRAVKQSRLSDDRRAMLRHELGPDAQSLSDEQMYALLARHADEKSGPGQTILIQARRMLGDDGWRAFMAAKLRSTGRNDPKADFDPAGFRAGWGGLSDNFKVQLAPEHRKAIDALDGAGRARGADGAPAPDPLAAAEDPFERAAARWSGEVGAMPPEERGQGASIVDKVLAAVNPIGSAQAAENAAPATEPLRITVTPRRSPDDEQILAAAEEISQMSPLERAATFKRSQEVSRYEPTWRDRIGAWLMNRGPNTLARRQFVEGLAGSTGIGPTGLSLIDLTPAGIPLAVQEAARKGDAAEVALGIVPGAPAAKPIPRLLGQFATTTTERILREIKEGRDYTLSLLSGRKPLDGYLVGNYRKEHPRNHVVPTAELKKGHRPGCAVHGYREQDPRGQAGGNSQLFRECAAQQPATGSKPRHA